jgi:hypothetical protein
MFQFIRDVGENALLNSEDIAKIWSMVRHRLIRVQTSSSSIVGEGGSIQLKRQRKEITRGERVQSLTPTRESEVTMEEPEHISKRKQRETEEELEEEGRATKRAGEMIESSIDNDIKDDEMTSASWSLFL